MRMRAVQVVVLGAVIFAGLNVLLFCHFPKGHATEPEPQRSPPPNATKLAPAIVVIAHLLCVDQSARCESRGDAVCKDAVTRLECLATCGGCEAMAKRMAEDTGVEIKVTRDIWWCEDEEPGCPALVATGACKTDRKRMLCMCKASCGFCRPGRMSADGACGDDADLCGFWAASGHCRDYPWMNALCRRSCRQCGQDIPDVRMVSLTARKDVAGEDTCADFSPHCERWALAGECRVNVQYMSAFCRSTCSFCTLAPPSAPPPPPGVGPNRRVTEDVLCPSSESASCPGWAQHGECERNPGYMMAACKRECQGCSFTWTEDPPRLVRLTQSVPLPGAMMDPGPASELAMPALGFGTAGLGEQTLEAVNTAIALGFRLLDSAQAPEWYREDLVGQAVEGSGVPREQLFLVSKLHPRHHGFDSALQRFGDSLSALRTHYVDLFLLHYPECSDSLCGSDQPPAGTWRDSWRALEQLHMEKKVRAIGVSNFDLPQLRELLSLAKVRPAVLQAHSDPLTHNAALQRAAEQADVAFMAYSSLGTQHVMSARGGDNPVLNNPTLQSISQRLGRTVAQVALRWALQRGQIVIPRSAREDHMRENLEIWDFSLSEDDMTAIFRLDGVLGPGA